MASKKCANRPFWTAFGVAGRIIEGRRERKSGLGGLAAQIRVPVNEDTVTRSMAGEDVQLTYALQWLDGQQQKPETPAASAAPATPTQKSAPALAVVLLTLGLLAVIAGRK